MSSWLTSNLPGLAVNFLLIESLQRFHQFYGEDVQVCARCHRRTWLPCLTSVGLFSPTSDRWNARLGAEIT